MKSISSALALVLLATIAACSQSDQQPRSNTQCSPYDPQCRISQAPAGTERLLPQDQSIQQMRQIPMSQ